MLTLNDLARSIAELTDCTPADAETFLRELFTLAAEELDENGQVEVPSLGRFAIMDGAVIFQPDSEIAEAINAPFADFEPIELPEGFNLNPEEVPADDTEDDSNGEDSTDDLIAELGPAVPEVQPQPEPETEPEAEVSDTASESGHHTITREIIVEKRGVGHCWAVMIAFACLVIGFIAGWFVASHYITMPSKIEVVPTVPSPAENNSGEELTAEQPVAIEATEEIPTEHPIILDTVRPGRFLTTMARTHYGQMDYWVYIYEANSGKISNPNNLESGTVLVIPPADSLGLEPGNVDKIAEAKRKANEIYARFN